MRFLLPLNHFNEFGNVTGDCFIVFGLLTRELVQSKLKRRCVLFFVYRPFSVKCKRDGDEHE